MEGKFSTLGNIPHLLHFKVSNYKLQSGNPELKKKGGTKGGTNEKGDQDKTGRRSKTEYGIWDLTRKILTKAKIRPLGQNWDFFGTILELSGTLSLFS